MVESPRGYKSKGRSLVSRAGKGWVNDSGAGVAVWACFADNCRYVQEQGRGARLLKSGGGKELQVQAQVEVQVCQIGYDGFGARERERQENPRFKFLVMEQGTRRPGWCRPASWNLISSPFLTQSE